MYAYDIGRHVGAVVIVALNKKVWGSSFLDGWMDGWMNTFIESILSNYSVFYRVFRSLVVKKFKDDLIKGMT